MEIERNCAFVETGEVKNNGVHIVGVVCRSLAIFYTLGVCAHISIERSNVPPWKTLPSFTPYSDTPMTEGKSNERLATNPYE